MKVTCDAGRSSVKVVGENEREFDLVGGAEDARVREIVDFATVNGCDSAVVGGSEAEATVAALASVGVNVTRAVEGATNDEAEGED